MTVAGESTSPAIVGDQAERQTAADDRPARRHDRRVPARTTTVLLLAVAVLVPTVLFGWRAMHAPINFDGGMNLQVAEHLARGDGYTRFYDQRLVFPHEVQTNGPFIYLAALAIKVFGENQFAYQFANILCIAALAAIVFALLRDNPVTRTVGPALVLLGIPLIWLYGLGGLGEIPTCMFLFAAVLALGEAVQAPKRAPVLVFGAFVAFGAAFATKTFAQGAGVALAAGLVCVLVAAPTRRLRWQVALAATGAALIPAVRELHRLISVGSFAGYRAWWSEERSLITRQAGLENTDTHNPVRAFLDHMHVLSDQVNFPAELLVIVLFVPLAWVGGLLLWRWRRYGIRRALADRTMAVQLMLAGIAGSYIGWWMLIIPDNRLWIRRIIPGLLALNLLYLFFVPWLARVGRAALRRRTEHGAGELPRWLLGTAAAAGVVMLAVAALPYFRARLDDNTRALRKSDEPWLTATRDAAAYVDAHDEMKFYGDEWWSAPVVSLMSDRDFYNLGKADLCSLDPARDRLVWDVDAMTIRSAEPWTRNGSLVYEQVATFGPFVRIYAVGPAPGRCG
jgi:Dolichyl-phosphate-mannose-protein mannosyltransferase